MVLMYMQWYEYYFMIKEKKNMAKEKKENMAKEKKENMAKEKITTEEKKVA